jgi:hypothetical protein
MQDWASRMPELHPAVNKSISHVCRFGRAGGYR